MLPVLFTLGPISISSFGFFVALGFLAAVYIIWRFIQVYELDKEAVLDLILLTFFGGLIGARLLFILENFAAFQAFSQFFLINRYPGLSFWGSLLIGVPTLWFFSRRTRVNFWQILDVGAIALLLATTIGDIGCFLGGCAYGVASNWFFATPVVGLIGKRLPVSLIEALLLWLVFVYLYQKALRFHFLGKIFSLSLIYLGVIRLILSPLRGDSRPLGRFINTNQLLSVLAIGLGVYLFYARSKRSILADLKGLLMTISSSRKRTQALIQLRRQLYSTQVSLTIGLNKSLTRAGILARRLQRRLNVKTTPKEFS